MQTITPAYQVGLLQGSLKKKHKKTHNFQAIKCYTHHGCVTVIINIPFYTSEVFNFSSLSSAWCLFIEGQSSIPS